MIVTEKVARSSKRCPLLRAGFNVLSSSHDPHHCLGSDCMMWVRVGDETHIDPMDNLGRCGLLPNKS